MRTETKILLLLLILPPALGELLSGSAPPVVFFQPVTLVLLILLYGGGTVLIREARVRWNLQWGVVWLAIAYGIIEEGLMVKSFFNPEWVDLGALSRYGMALGTQWVWVVMLTIYHATMSTLIPIAVIDLAWPAYRDMPLLGRKGLMMVSAGLVLVTVLGMIFMGSEQDGRNIPYYPEPPLLIAAFVAVATLIFLAYKSRGKVIVTHRPTLWRPFWWGVAGFLLMALNLIVPHVLANLKVPAAATLASQLTGAIFIGRFVAYPLYHRNISPRHTAALITGAAFFWIPLALFSEFVDTQNPDPTTGMSAIGGIFLVLVVLWRRRVRKMHDPSNLATR